MYIFKKNIVFFVDRLVELRFSFILFEILVRRWDFFGDVNYLMVIEIIVKELMLLKFSEDFLLM